LLKYTKAQRVTFTDYNDIILENLRKNIFANKKNHNQGEDVFEKEPKNINECYNLCPFNENRISIENLDWKDFEKYEKKYDIIIGSELIYQGGNIEELVKLINKMLQGKLIFAFFIKLM